MCVYIYIYICACVLCVCSPRTLRAVVKSVLSYRVGGYFVNIYVSYI